mgnify:FL=1
MSSKPEALLISAYDATSHARWRHGLTRALSEDFSWTEITLPARHFAWRSRGNALAMLAPGLQQKITSRSWDLVIATSVTDLVTLRGFFPDLHGATTCLYVHENQFAYPWRGAGKQNALHIQLQFILNAACVDHIVFNSRYNLETALEGARALLAKMPDHVPPNLCEQLTDRSLVIPVGISPAIFDLARAGVARSGEDPVAILWNHRWEYDKSPERAFGALERLVEQGAGDRFELHVVGESFRRTPDAFARARDTLDKQIATWGYLEQRADYEALLARADIVLSSAAHEFQGLAMIEAMAAGARPVAPDRLAYPEYIPSDCLYASFEEDEDAEIEALTAHLGSLLEQTSSWRAQRTLHSQRVKRYDWDAIETRWRALLELP